MSLSHSAAIRCAEERFPAVAERFARVYAMELPEHVTYCAAFFLGLSDAERAAAEHIDANGLFGVGEWFRDGALDKQPWADERTHGRFRRDPPELVTFVSGGSDGSHWGLWYDEPRELPRVCAHNWARDSAETAAGAPTLLASIRARRREGDRVPKAIEGWLDELVEREVQAHARQGIGAPHPRSSWCVGGMGPFGVSLPDDWTSHHAERERYEAYRRGDPIVAAWITTAKAELARGAPGRALLLGRELHWMDADAHRVACTDLLASAYRALGRDALAGIVEAHHAARDMPSVDAYAPSSSPLCLAAARGDAAEVARRIDDPRIDDDVLRTAAWSARSPEVQELLFSRSHAALEAALGAALHRASPRWSKDLHAGARELARARERGEGREALLKRLLDEKQYAVWRAIADHEGDLDVAAWERDAERLVGRALDVLGPETVMQHLLGAHLFAQARPLAELVDVRWTDPVGSTLLHTAAQAGADAVAARLLARGADAAATNARGESPRDAAKALWQRDKTAGSRLLELLAPEPAAPVAPPRDPAAILAGDRVRHAKFGEGRVEAVATDGKLTIAFEGGARVLLPRFVERIGD